MSDQNPLSMSDEDIMNMPYPTDEATDTSEAEVSEDESVAEETTEQPVEDTEETVEDAGSEEEDISEEEDDAPADVFSDDEKDSIEDNVEEAPETASDIDYKAEYEKLLTPFKANGKEMKIDSVDDALSLMQMGANYNKKMAALKPNLKLMKMLEKHSLLDESKLSFLIDLDKKNPDAIKRLLQDSNIDPLEVDLESTDYTPNSYTVQDQEFELDQILDEIKETDTYSKTIDVLGNKWDESSRKVIVDNPQLIKLINEHMQSGIYAQITEVVERERMLGRLSDVSDIEAYRQVGDRLFSQQPRQSAPAPQAKKKPDPKVASRKKAAASTKSAPSNASKQPEFNPLSMSDDEFEKIVADKFL